MDQSALLTSLVERVFLLLLAVVLARLLAAVALTAVARMSADPVRRARAAALAVRIGPRFARGVLAAVVGAGVVAGAAGPVLAAPAPPRPLLSGAAVPDLDRLVVAVSPVATNASPPARPRTRSAAPASRSRDVHVVRTGESLWSIAAHALGPAASPSATATSWPRWYAANRAVVGPDPAVLHPGQRLRAPAVDATRAAR